MQVKTELSKHQIKDLFTFLTIIKPVFENFSIVRGQFRSRNNDRTCIVETHFRCFDQMEFSICDIKAVRKELSCFAKSPNITVTLDDGTVTFSDGKHTISSYNLGRNYSSNPFIDSDEMSHIWDEQIDATKLLMKETLPKVIASRIYKASHNGHSPSIILKPEKGDPSKGNLYISQWTGEAAELSPVYTNKDTIGFHMPMQEGARILIPSLSYAFAKSNLITEIYPGRNPASVGIKHKARIGNISVATYSHSFYRIEEADTSPEG